MGVGEESCGRLVWVVVVVVENVGLSVFSFDGLGQSVCVLECNVCVCD